MPTPPIAEAPRAARLSYVLGAVSIFVPVLVVILLPTLPLVVLLIVENAALATALASLVLGGSAIRATAGGSRPGRAGAVFGILLALVSLGYNVPLLLGLYAR